jgi:hypothetical protein
VSFSRLHDPPAGDRRVDPEAAGAVGGKGLLRPAGRSGGETGHWPRSTGWLGQWKITCGKNAWWKPGGLTRRQRGGCLIGIASACRHDSLPHAAHVRYGRIVAEAATATHESNDLASGVVQGASTRCLSASAECHERSRWPETHPEPTCACDEYAAAIYAASASNNTQALHQVYSVLCRCCAFN